MILPNGHVSYAHWKADEDSDLDYMDRKFASSLSDNFINEHFELPYRYTSTKKYSIENNVNILYYKKNKC